MVAIAWQHFPKANQINIFSSFVDSLPKTFLRQFMNYSGMLLKLLCLALPLLYISPSNIKRLKEPNFP